MIEPLKIDELMPLLRMAQAEDLGPADVTSAGCVPAGANAVGAFVAREAGVLAGTVLLAPLAGLYSDALTVASSMPDGAAFSAGDTIAAVRGPAGEMLAFERVALNFLQRLCGVASVTRRYVDAVAGTEARILDTRKTTPGWRSLEKYAVRCGGGTNHRVGLFDGVLVKDNHIALGHQNDLPALAISLRRQFPGTPIEIEVDTLDQLRSLLAGAADAVDMVLLDNMTPAQLAEAVRIREQLCRTSRPQFEASGGVTLDTVSAIARTGVERISVGAITHSVRALDISLEIEPA